MKFDPRLLAKMLLSIPADTDAQQMAETLMSKLEAIAIKEFEDSEKANSLTTGTMTDIEVAEIFESREERLAYEESVNHTVERFRPLLDSVTPCMDDDFSSALEENGARISPIFFEDYVSFAAGIGIGERGTVTLYVENNLKGHANLIVTTPFTPEEWKAKTEDQA